MSNLGTPGEMMRFNGTPEETEFGVRLDELEDPMLLRELVTRLWSLLDDIDTVPDIVKPEGVKGYQKALEMAVKRSEARHAYVVSDGYSLFLPKPKKGGPQ